MVAHGAHVGISLGRVLAGFAIAAVLGIGLGVACAWFGAVGRVLRPPIETLRPIPPLAWIPIAIVWFGLGEPSKVFVIDPLPNKRELAVEFGATAAFSSFEEAFTPIQEATYGAMAHSVILIPGRMSGSYIEPAMSLVRKCGTLAVIGMGSFEEDETKLNLAWLTCMNKTIKGGQLGGGSPQEDVLKLVRLYKEGKLPLEKLVTGRYKLEEINEGYQDMRDGKNIRGLIVYGDADY